MALPAKLGYCTVKGRFISAVLDGSDAGRDPDGVPLEGLTITIATTLNPPVAYFRDGDEATTILITPIVCETDDSGNLVGPDGEEDILIVASNDTLLSPRNWTYTARITSPLFKDLVYTFVAPSGGTVNLASIATTPPSSGNDTYIIEGGTP